MWILSPPFGFEETGDDLHPTDANGNIKIDRDTDHIAVWSLGTRGFVSLLGKDKAFPNIMENEIIRKISVKHEKTPAQIALKFTNQRGIAAIPKSTNATRIKENISIFDFQLDNEDIEALAALDQGPNARICDFNFFQGVKNHPEYPF